MSGSRLFRAACLSLIALPLAAQDSLRAPVRHRSIAEDLQLFSQVLNQIRVNHADSLDTHELLMAAIQGMVEAADPHSFVIPATRFDSTKEALARGGKLYPVPLNFRFVSGAPLVTSVSAGSKAISLDILPGDELVSVDGHPIAATSEVELDLALAGQKNSSATLVFRRRRADGTIVRLDRSVPRERVEEATAVPVAIMLSDLVGYVRVTTFLGDRVADDLHAALDRLEKAGMKKLVLDLRDNGGGRVDEAKRIAGEFLPSGTVVYTSFGRKAAITDTGRVQRSFWRSERQYPIVLMVDDGTASASEMVAGALQDHDRALIVGRTTFGKSLLMQTFPLTDGSFMTLVVGQVRTPCGRVIQREFRNESRRDYYLDAGQSTGESNRPSCKTDHGRTVYGGGGIVPDVRIAGAQTPTWLSQVAERGLLMTWSAGYVDRAGSALSNVDSLAKSASLDAAALSSFRQLAAASGITIPDDADNSAKLSQSLLRSIAYAKFGDAGYYRVIAVNDPEIRSAVKAFDRFGELNKP